MRNVSFLLSCAASLALAIACTEAPSVNDGEKLAQQYCSSCHQYVSPSSLPREIWSNGILENMGFRLGIIDSKSTFDSLFLTGLDPDLAEEKGIYPQKAQISIKHWEAIKKFYLDNSLPQAQLKSDFKTPSITDQFEVRPSRYTRRPPLTTMVQIIDNEQSLVVADGKSNVNALIFLDENLRKKEEIYLRQSPIQLIPLPDGMAMLSAGKNIYPNDFQEGSIEKIYKSEAANSFDRSKILADKLRRPVHVNQSDFDKNGSREWVICEFGNNVGQVTIYSDDFSQSTDILDLPGALKSITHDLDGDGWDDLLVLVSQGREGIVYLRNVEGSFEAPRYLLEFSPLMGSTYFEMIDFDEDGDLDILYTCGDNADQSPILKSFHGIYIFSQDENQEFEQIFFHALPGAYKAIVGNFDEDSDLEIAAISFFPDYASDPTPFLFLDKANNTYEPFTIADANQGRWMVMDAGDFEGDGDLDIVIGSFVRFYPTGDETGLFQRWIDESPAVLLLENKSQP